MSAKKNDFKTGTEPGIGAYACRKCKAIVRLDENTDKLPPCPKCKGSDYELPKAHDNKDMITVKSDSQQRFSTTDARGNNVALELRQGLNTITKEQYELCRNDKSVHITEG